VVPPGALFQCGDLVELLSSTDERRADTMDLRQIESLQSPDERKATRREDYPESLRRHVPDSQRYLPAAPKATDARVTAKGMYLTMSSTNIVAKVSPK